MALWLILAACGGGLRDKTELRDLEPSEAKELCREYSEEKTATCTRKGYSVEATVGGTDCSIDGEAVLVSCDATVADFRDCMDALFADPCLVITGLPQVCVWMRDCLVDTDDTGV
jgi:hypothetical protein